MINKVKTTIEKNSLLKKGDTIIVALSGGADSVCLLDVLLKLKDELDLKICAAHVNHCLRGEESDGDENFVRSLCSSLDLELFVKKVDVKALAEEEKIGLELCGRNVRYAFFEELAIAHNAKIATAHNANDNTETCLFNLVRGSGLKGVCGIPLQRGCFVRPLLAVTRAEIENHCIQNNLEFVTDSTNLQNDYTRNKIRNTVLPLLREFNPNLENTITRFTGQMGEFSAFFDFAASAALKSAEVEFSGGTAYCLDKLNAMHPTLLQNAVNLIYRSLTGTSLEEKHVLLCCEVIKNRTGAVNLPDFYDARCYKDKFFKIAKAKNTD
ncbi:MAG: tRNA lysidine(34) synthetase TilS [Oscillospiraceae bacterium]|jgi:tRNA(Ile)-lysidine synthase|nr:tRNA lysidine(34) synthetase TilS [Oscillospiraceae bacterium]